MWTSFLPQAALQQTNKQTNEQLHCDIEKVALHESDVFPPLSCEFQAPTFRFPGFSLTIRQVSPSLGLRFFELRFAVRSDSNCHRFAAISNLTIRIARPKTVRTAVKVLLFYPFDGC